MADNTLTTTDVIDSLRPVVAEVMAIEDVTAGRFPDEGHSYT